MPSFFGSVSPASEDRAECGNDGASVLADGDDGLGQMGSSSEVIEGGVLKKDEAGPEMRRTEMELEAEFVRDQMNQYQQVRPYWLLFIQLSHNFPTDF